MKKVAFLFFLWCSCNAILAQSVGVHQKQDSVGCIYDQIEIKSTDVECSGKVFVTDSLDSSQKMIEYFKLYFRQNTSLLNKPE